MFKKLFIILLAVGFTGSVYAEVLKGRISAKSKKAGTLQIDIKKKGPAVVRIGPNTVFEGASGLKELNPPDLIQAEQEPGQPAKSIKKIIFGLPPGVEIGKDELLKIMSSGDKYYLFDARPTKVFDCGYLPTATSAFPDGKDFLSVLPEDKGALLVFYCGGPTCPFTGKAIKKAQEAGYTNLKGFQAGLPAWNKAKLPLYSHPKCLSKNLDPQHVILDVRDTAASSKVHIKGAVAMPVADLQAMTKEFIKTKTKADLPGASDKRAPIIVYANTDSENSVMKGYAELRKWGYKKVTILEGGLNTWQSFELPTATGAAASTIVYVKKLTKGAIAPEEFTALVKSPGDTVFIDVRDDKEVSTGVLTGAQHIPLDKLEDSAGTLPKDKEIILYCANGIRAQMGYEMLSKQGFNVRFLNEEIVINKDGQYKM
ncbi:rhodanese-like domain-containing protein [Gammaproteobacteria bacterium]|nr:rhodanese-like domain-containing protein [Gammaproteobacteria bacterium]